ncbi:cache domain-containing protein [Paraburkholderia sp. EG287B]|uniref:cache domain-containing protein n=1 Tax=Paraburkholderia sp. EG287B TaxID=3237010 RepID=UPI0034D26D36
MPKKYKQGLRGGPETLASNGVYLFKEIVAVIKQEGQGFVSYSFKRIGSNDVAPKISYSVSYQPWDWILTTGLYVDDIDAAFRVTLYWSLGILAAIALALSAVVAVVNRGILRSLGGDAAVEAAREVTQQNAALVEQAAAAASALAAQAKDLKGSVSMFRLAGSHDMPARHALHV